MKLMIVPKPVLDKNMAIMSYCFRYRRGDEYLGDQPARAFDGIINLPCLTVLEEVGLEGFTNGEPLMVPLNKFTLLSDVSLQCTQPPEKIIFLIDQQVPPEEMFIDCIKKLEELGYRFAIENVKDYDYMKPIIDICDYVLISFRHNDMKGLDTYRTLARRFRKQAFVASDVSSMEVFGQIKDAGFEGFEGSFYNIPVAKGNTTIAPVKINRIQLINIVRKPDFAIEDVVKIVSQDPSLSISLLKLVNSPYLGISQKIKSVQHAVAMLGQTEVRKWVTTATNGLLAEDKPNQLTRLSLIRARFAENLARHFEMAIHAPGLFLMGLFSILDVVLEMSMGEALQVISVSERIREALIFREGEYSKVLNLILVYETADWNEVNRLMTLSNVKVEDVFFAYMEAVQWYASITVVGEEFLSEEEAEEVA